MNKSEFSWVIIRALGLMTLLIGLFLGFQDLKWLWADGGLKVRFSWPPVFLIVSGLYLLFFGGAIHALFLREGYKLPFAKQQPEKPRSVSWLSSKMPEEPTDPVTTLTMKEESEYREWLLQNPQFKARPEVDRIALFRDFQKT